MPTVIPREVKLGRTREEARVTKGKTVALSRAVNISSLNMIEKGFLDWISPHIVPKVKQE